MVIRNHGMSPKIKNIMLAAPDIDVDVFRRQIAEIEAGGKHAPITLFVSQDDRALNISKLVAGDEPRLGAVDPLAEPFKGILERANVHVVDLTQVASDDATNHGKYASGDVVHAIGLRLATGQKLNDAKSSFGETLGAIAVNATNAVGNTTATVVSAPFQASESVKPTPGSLEDVKPLVQ
jgi:esterase/lipase superfamily enzyme